MYVRAKISVPQNEAMPSPLAELPRQLPFPKLSQTTTELLGSKSRLLRYRVHRADIATKTPRLPRVTSIIRHYKYHALDSRKPEPQAMDPLSAFGIACNLMQVISFGLETVSLCEEIYKTGHPDLSLAESGRHLEKIGRSLTQELKLCPTSLTADDKEFIKVANQCAKDARALQDEAAYLEPKKAHKIGAAIGATVRSFRHKRRLDRLKQNLLGSQKPWRLPFLHVCAAKHKLMRSRAAMTLPAWTLLCRTSSSSTLMARRRYPVSLSPGSRLWEIT